MHRRPPRNFSGGDILEIVLGIFSQGIRVAILVLLSALALATKSVFWVPYILVKSTQKLKEKPIKTYSMQKEETEIRYEYD